MEKLVNINKYLAVINYTQLAKVPKDKYEEFCILDIASEENTASDEKKRKKLSLETLPCSANITSIDLIRKDPVNLMSVPVVHTISYQDWQTINEAISEIHESVKKCTQTMAEYHSEKMDY